MTKTTLRDRRHGVKPGCVEDGFRVNELLERRGELVRIVHFFLLFTRRVQQKKMNERKHAVIEAALAALMRTTGLKATAFPESGIGPDRGADALIEVSTEQGPHRFAAQVKAVNRFETPAQVMQRQARFDAAPMLVAPYVTPRTAELCRRLNLAFLDTAGNAFLSGPGLLISVTGEKRPMAVARPRFRSLRPAGLRITFALLCRPELLSAGYREVAHAAGVALGSVGPTMKDLEARGFLLVSPARGRRLADRPALLDEWVTHYRSTLRPTLNPRRFESSGPVEDAVLAAVDACWSGGPAADRLTHALRPERFIVYSRPPVRELAVRLRLRAIPTGRIEILDKFWTFRQETERPGLAPLPLIYADLLASGDGRNLEAAKVLYERFLEPELLPAD